MNKIFRWSILIFIVGTAVPAMGAPEGFDVVKKRVTDALLQSGINDGGIESLLQHMQDDGTWSDIDYTDLSREGFQHSRHYTHMVALARAYRTRSSKYFNSSQVIFAIEKALKNWVDNDYRCDNWWYDEIGVPDNLVQVMLLVGDELPGDLVERAQPIIQRADIDGPGARPGGDRIKIAGIEAKNLLFRGEKEKFDRVIKVIENEIQYVEWIGKDYGYTYRNQTGGFGNREAGGRGIQFDNSFHHRYDGVNNTLSYGMGYAEAFIEWAVYTTGTEYAFSAEKLEQLVDYYLDGICKTSVFGKYPDPGVKNRSISRRGALHPYNAKAVEDLLLTTDYRKDELQEIAGIRRGSVKPTLSHATFFWHSEHFAFQRPDFFTSVRMYSTRVHNMEQPYNSEGLLNHHRGDGTNHISPTGTEYDDIAPVFDYQKVPGTTVVQKPEMPEPQEIQKRGLTDFVGAATDGLYGAVAFDFKSPHDPLIARKSWFFFDDLYVCLGAGISCKQHLPVVTTINQCLLRSKVILSSGSEIREIEKGEQAFEDVDWIVHDGVGYLFPSPSDVWLKSDEATGSWWKINKQSDSPKEMVHKDLFKLWLDHGERASDASYEYIVVPATTPEAMKEGSVASGMEIISNSPEIQAVWNEKAGICQVVFYKAGEIQITERLKVVSDHPGIVMLKTKSNLINEITVSDPTRLLGRYHLSITGITEKGSDSFDAHRNRNTGLTDISIELPTGNYAGESVTIRL